MQRRSPRCITRGNSCVSPLPGFFAMFRQLFDVHFVWKKERRAAIIEAHQKHPAIQIVHFSHDFRLFVKAHATFLVANGL